MLGAAQRHADEKTWHVVCARLVLIQDEHDELVYHCVLSKRSRSRSTCVADHLPPLRAFFDVAEYEVGSMARAYSITSSAMAKKVVYPHFGFGR
jgi:hypothetical protein